MSKKDKRKLAIGLAPLVGILLLRYGIELDPNIVEELIFGLLALGSAIAVAMNPDK